MDERDTDALSFAVECLAEAYTVGTSIGAGRPFYLAYCKAMLELAKALGHGELISYCQESLRVLNQVDTKELN